MAPKSTPRAHHIWLIAILIIGLALRVFGAFHPVEVLLDKTLPDDAFYYFQIARNIAAGHGVTFDTLAPTNGFHPLWLCLITPLFALFHDDRAVQAALLLASCLDGVTMWLLYRIVSRLTGRPEAGVLAALLYFLNPVVWLFALNGLETAVNLAVIAVATERLVVWSSAPRLTFTKSLGLGVLWGLALLARTDNIFFLIASSSVILLLWPQERWPVRLQRLASAAVVALCLTAPWFWWNYATFGSFVQVSGTILPWLEQVIFTHNTGAAPLSVHGLLHTLWFLYDSAIWTWTWAGFERLPNAESFALSSILLGVFAAAFLLNNSLARQRLFQQTKTILFLLIYVIIVFLYHAGIRWVYRTWYTLPITWTLILLVGLFYAALCDGLGLNKPGQADRHIPIYLLVGFLLLVRSASLWRLGIYTGQSNLLVLVQAINQMPVGTRVGVADSGYVGFRAQRTVVNLDGVVNNEAAQAMVEHRLMNYVLAKQIDYVYTQPRYLLPELWGADFQEHLQKEADFFKVIRTIDDESH